MRGRTTYTLLMMVAILIVVLPSMTVVGQPNFKKPGGKSKDPGETFDKYLAKGRPYFLISEAFFWERESLMKFAQEKGITEGQITRHQYVEFRENWANPLKIGGMRPMSPDKGPRGADASQPGGENPIGRRPDKLEIQPPSGVLKPEASFDPFAVIDADFRSRDRNGDGRLNPDEMKDSLRSNLTRWDRNNDGLIDQAEYREYMLARERGDNSPGNSNKGIASIIIEENELDLKPTVLRAGKLPKNMPGWFKELDTDNDGQVALFEWRAGKKTLDEFRNWDLNEDGFITPEECLRQQEVIAKGGSGTSTGSGLASRGGDSTSERPSFGKGGGGFGGFSGFGKGGDSGKGKGKRTP